MGNTNSNIDNFDNVFYDHYDEVKLYDCVAEVWEESKTIVLVNTGKHIGLFDKSDIIIMYGKDGFPSIITERIFKKNFTRREWWGITRMFKNKLKVIQEELGFHISVSYSRDYIDYVHYKQEWWLWAREQLSSR